MILLRAYVGRGGLKLEAALREFEIIAEGLVCLDVGASTGGLRIACYNTAQPK